MDRLGECALVFYTLGSEQEQFLQVLGVRGVVDRLKLSVVYLVNP